jgi:serine/threonine-protein phosphatase 2A regulatory subunit A
MDDEEEVLLALAEVLGPQFLDYIGGPAHALHIIKILEKLCQLDESTVRDKVVFNLSFHCFRLVKASRKYLHAFV